MRIDKHKLDVQRAVCGLTIAELARRAGVNKKTVQRSKIGCTALTIHKIANALECEPRDIIAGEVES